MSAPPPQTSPIGHVGLRSALYIPHMVGFRRVGLLSAPSAHISVESVYFLSSLSRFERLCLWVGNLSRSHGERRCDHAACGPDLQAMPPDSTCRCVRQEQGQDLAAPRVSLLEDHAVPKFRFWHRLDEATTWITAVRWKSIENRRWCVH